MPPAHQNVNVSFRLDQAAFLRSLAAKDHGEMSRFLRDLLDASQAYQEYARSH
jgi:hypothetical protein